jgi:hypothetical protein
MTANRWTWANLNDDQLQLVVEAERSVRADYLLVYKPGEQSTGVTGSPGQSLKAALLTESQLERLHGLEQRLNAVIVAYDDTAKAAAATMRRSPSGIA